MTNPAIAVAGIGAVSPAGWGLAALREALQRTEPLPFRDVPRPGSTRTLRMRQTPASNPRPAFMSHARLRRTSPVTQFAVGAALEALGPDRDRVAEGMRLGIVYCAMSGCVNYSRRFYDEVLKDPATASPLVFPETVYNAPASHLAALLGAGAINYTLVGDPGVVLQGLAVAADWLTTGRVDGCLVVGAEETDWLSAEAVGLFQPETIVSDGAGALYLKSATAEPGVRLACVCDPQLFQDAAGRAQAARRVRQQMAPFHSQSELLADSLQGIVRLDRDEQEAWSDWTQSRLSVKAILGESFTAAAAWQCVAAVEALSRPGLESATVSIVGCNEQAIAAQFVRTGRT